MRLLIAVKTCHWLDYFVNDETTDWLNSQGLRYLDVGERVRAQRETFLSPEGLSDAASVIDGTVDYKFFYGNRLRRTDVKPNQRPGTEGPAPRLREPLDDEIFLNVGDNYTQNSAKVKEILRYARQHDYDYVMLIDDDTFVYLNRILLTDFAQHDYSGAVTETFHPGSCVFLSRAAMAAVEKSRITSHCDDLWMGQALTAAGIPTHDIPVIRHGTGQDYPVRFVSPKLIDAYASLHSCSPNVMRTLWTQRTTQSSEQPKVTDGVVSKITPSASVSPDFEDAKLSSPATSPTLPEMPSSDSDLKSLITPASLVTQFMNDSESSETGLPQTNTTSDLSFTVTSETL